MRRIDLQKACRLVQRVHKGPSRHVPKYFQRNRRYNRRLDSHSNRGNNKDNNSRHKSRANRILTTSTTPNGSPPLKRRSASAQPGRRGRRPGGGERRRGHRAPAALDAIDDGTQIRVPSEAARHFPLRRHSNDNQDRQII